MAGILDMLPDEVYQIIFRQVKQTPIEQAAAIGARRNRFTYIPNKRTIDSVIYHCSVVRLRRQAACGRTERASTPTRLIQMEIGRTGLDGRKVLSNHTAKGLGFVSQTTSQHVGKVRGYADEIV